MLHLARILTLCALAALFASCAVQRPTFPAGESCETAAFTVVDGFSGARRGTCTVVSADRVRLDILPENDGYINDSPWYAFKLVPSVATTAEIELRYSGGHHRYWPKISTDAIIWRPLDERYVSSSSNGRRAVVQVPLSTKPVWIAAQEILSPSLYEVWNRAVADQTGIRPVVLGESTAGLPIHIFDSNRKATDVLFLVGRQHPPEVSGAFGFFAFAETVFGNTELAREFRARYRVIAIPLLNPDGVVSGNWRHNLGGVDLNRDWGPFTQAETKLVSNLLDGLDQSGHQLRVFVDFHSTKKNVFYSQIEADVTNPPLFTRTWLRNARARIKNYPFTNQEGPTSNTAIAKNYIYTRYGIPSVTFEVGDETDREAARAAARIFAEELMKLMLSLEY